MQGTPRYEESLVVGVSEECSGGARATIVGNRQSRLACSDASATRRSMARSLHPLQHPPQFSRAGLGLLGCASSSSFRWSWDLLCRFPRYQTHQSCVLTQRNVPVFEDTVGEQQCLRVAAVPSSPRPSHRDQCRTRHIETNISRDTRYNLSRGSRAGSHWSTIQAR